MPARPWCPNRTRRVLPAEPCESFDCFLWWGLLLGVFRWWIQLGRKLTCEPGCAELLSQQSPPRRRLCVCTKTGTGPVFLPELRCSVTQL